MNNASMANMNKNIFLAVLISIVYAAHGMNISYTYDNAGRLTQANCGNGASLAYTYDANGNLLSRTATAGVAPNQPPAAANTNLSAAQNRPATLAAAKLAALCADPEGDPISVTAVGNSTNGALVTLADGIITYTPVTNFVGLDLFSYTISDSRGNYATGKVEVAVYPGNLASLNIVSVARVSGNFQFTFAGIPGRTYQVERALAATGPWTNLTSVVAESTGLTSYLDPNSPAGAAYYRTVYLQP